MEAARRAISSPLLEGASVNGARGVIINVTGGPDLSLVEVSEASLIVQEAADEDANIIFGAVVDPTLTGKVKITVIATGFDEKGAKPFSENAQQRAEARAIEVRSEPIPMVQAAKANGGAAVVPMQETLPPSSNSYDKNDLDVPAFLRRKLAES